MPDTPPLHELALERLRQQGKGNGLKASDFEILEHTEKTIVLQGELKLSPRFDIQSKGAAGGIKNAKALMLPSRDALEGEIKRRRADFDNSKTWVQEVVQELKADQTHGWGHQDALVSIPSYSATLAATDACPECHGQGQVTCRTCNGEGRVYCQYCQGRREEPCYHCQSTGQDPVNPEQPCAVCHGTRYAPCRYCQATGMVTCPDCQGRGGTPCHNCRGTGKLSQMAKVKAGASTTFRLKNATEQTSTLLRCLDRLGMANLGKGHADISILDQKEDADPHTLEMTATFPFCEAKVRIGKGTGSFGILGKRNAILGVPTFLDRVLKKGQEKLESAARFPSLLPEAMKLRAIAEAVRFTASGKNNPVELRKIYPNALSPQAAADLMKQAARTVAGVSKGMQIAASVIAGLIGTGLAFTYYFSPSFRMMLPTSILSSIMFVLPLFTAILGWFLMNEATCLKIKHAIPGATPKRFVKPTSFTLALIALDLALPAAVLWGIRLVIGM